LVPLSHVLARRPSWFSVVRRTKALAGVALAMEYLHENDVVIGNLHPSNIVLDLDRDVKIVNFGANQSNTGPYAAEGGKEGDVFAFGVLLFEMITGPVTVSEGLELAAWRARFQKNAAQMLPASVSATIKDFVGTCVSDPPSVRPSAENIVEMMVQNDFWPFGEMDTLAVEEFQDYLHWVGC
jgi:serine/threonine protein kinase